MSSYLNFLRAAKQFSSKVSVQQISPLTVRYGLGSVFSVESLNPEGDVQPWSVLAVADFAFNFHYLKNTNKHCFLDFDQLLPYVVFFAAADVTIEKKMFDPLLDKSNFDVEYSLGHIGRTSITLKYDFFPPDSQEKLSTGRIRTVLINPETRKPQQFPDWWLEKYSHYLRDDSSPLIVSSATESTGQKLDTFTSKVVPSLLDSNLHCGWYMQAKTYMDAYVNWHINNFGFHGKGKAFRNVKYMKLLFKNEASLGEELKIKMHSVPGNENNVQLFMANEKVSVSECFMEFFPNNMLPGYESKL